MSVILVEGVVQVAIDPRELWNVAEEEWSLRVLGWMRLVSLPERIQFLVHIGVNNIIT